MSWGPFLFLAAVANVASNAQAIDDVPVVRSETHALRSGGGDSQASMVVPPEMMSPVPTDSPLIERGGSIGAEATGESVANQKLKPWKKFIKNSEVSFFTSLTGPSFGTQTGRESYNVYAGDVWPLQTYSTLSYGYRFPKNWTLGLELSGIGILAQGVSTRLGGPVARGVQLFHPAIQLKRANAIVLPWLNVWMGLQFFLPTSEFAARTQKQLLSVAFEQTWTLTPVKAPWSFGLNTRLQPTLYRGPAAGASSGMRRQSFFFSFGHFLNFDFLGQFQLATSTVFDADHALGSRTPFEANAANDDRWKIELFWFPRVKVLSSVGLFLQGRIWEPRAISTVVGADFTLRL